MKRFCKLKAKEETIKEILIYMINIENYILHTHTHMHTPLKEIKCHTMSRKIFEPLCQAKSCYLLYEKIKILKNMWNIPTKKMKIGIYNIKSMNAQQTKIFKFIRIVVLKN